MITVTKNTYLHGGETNRAHNVAHRLSWFVALAVIQIMCAAFFISEFLTEVLGLRSWAIPFAWREALQILASLGLALGALASVLLMRHARRDLMRTRQKLRAASGAFFDVMQEFFIEWSLSPAESDVALFAVRGYSNTEIATLRGKSEATIKSQMNAVFRKSGVTGRSQFMGLFVDALLADDR